VPVKSTRPPKDSPKKTTGRWKNRNISSSERMKRKIRRNHSNEKEDKKESQCPLCE
jgi:hypothetical protein